MVLSPKELKDKIWTVNEEVIEDWIEFLDNELEKRYRGEPEVEVPYGGGLRAEPDDAVKALISMEYQQAGWWKVYWYRQHGAMVPRDRTVVFKEK